MSAFVEPEPLEERYSGFCPADSCHVPAQHAGAASGDFPRPRYCENEGRYLVSSVI